MKVIFSQAYRRDVDGLRSVAVLPVVLFHAGIGFPGGFVGVDIFFVISGFLITGIIYRDIENKRFSLLRFYQRRLRRLYPALFVMLAVTTVAAAWLMLPSDFADYGHSMFATTLYASNFFFFFQNGYFTEASYLKPLLHTWSLSVEEQFYILFPPVLWLLSRCLSKRAVIGILAVGAVLSFIASGCITPRNENLAFYLLPTRAWELALGALLALGACPSLAGRAKLANGLGVVALAMIMVVVFAYSSETVFPGTAAFWPCLAAAILLWVGTEQKGMASRILAAEPMVFIGKISYSLYLWHWPIVVFATYGGPVKLSLSVGLMCVAASVLMGYLSWRFVEQPVRNGKFAARGRDAFVWSGVASAAAVGVGVLVMVNDGFPGRQDQALLTSIEPEQYLHPDRFCHNVTPQRVRDGAICVRGAMGVTPNFVLVGDSHGDALSPALFAAADEAGAAGWQFTAPGFIPVMGVSVRGQTDNKPVLAALLGFLRDQQSVETVVLTGYWLHYVTGYTYRHHGTVLVDDASSKVGTEHNAIALQIGLSRLIAEFPGRQFIILDDVPSGNALYLKHYARSIVLPWRAPVKGLPAAEAKAQRDAYEPTLRAVAAVHPNVTYLPVLADMCGNEICPLFDSSGDPIYRDGDHLTSKGALRLAPKLAPVFARE